MKQLVYQILALILTSVMVLSCHSKSSKTKEQVMQERLAERLDRWKSDMEKKCRNEVEDKATTLTDSIIIANAKLNRDTSIHLLIPGRPTRPDYTPPTDSVPIKPILNN